MSAEHPRTVRELGERGLIAEVAARLPVGGAAVLVGNGDDAAVLALPDGRVVATLDVLVEGTHFRTDWSSGYDVGRKAAAANLADVAAMGAVGTALLVGLVVPGDAPVAWALALADGLRDEAATVGAVVVGGDTVSGEWLTVSVTALGDLQGRAPVRRTGARAGDAVVFAGRLGWSAAGLAVLSARGAATSGAAESEGVRSDLHGAAESGPELAAARPSWAGPLVAAHRRPAPPYAVGPALADLGATAMCDVSDGLVLDAGTLAAEVALDLRHVVDDPQVRECWAEVVGEPGAGPVHWTLHGGEDHGLLATVPPDRLPDALALGCLELGVVVPGDGVLLDGRPIVAEPWEHFPPHG